MIETAKRSGRRRAAVVCIEVKLAEKWDRKWESPIRALAADGRIRVERMLGVYSGNRSYRFDDFEVHPVREFFERLHDGEIF